MTVKTTVNRMLKSTDVCPFRGKLSIRYNYIEAINLAEFCKGGAQRGDEDESLGFSTDHWEKVISKLEQDSLQSLKDEEKFVKDLIVIELKGNLSILLDPKKKYSFSIPRINTWANLVADRIHRSIPTTVEH